MCGFSGILCRDESFIHSSQILLAPRARDSEGIYISDDISLYHAHLQISDVDKNTSQPYEDEKYIICFVGEIYNRNYLLEKCLLDGEDIYTEAQIFSFLFQKFGTTGISFINGEFNLCIFEKSSKTTYLFRDRYGTKALYYSFIHGNLAFSSEIKALIQKNNKLSKNGFYDSYIFGFCISPHTLFENIYSLKPGHYIKSQNNEVLFFSYEDYIPQENGDFLEIFENSVKRRIPKFQNKILFPLSGGADSNLTLYFLKKHFSGEIITYSFLSSINKEDVKTASYNAKIHQCKHYIIPLSEELAEGNHVIHEGINDLVYISQIVKNEIPEIKEVKVEFSGDGREELFLKNTHFHIERIVSIYDFFLKKYYIGEYNINSKFLNHSMFDFNLQLLEKVTLTQGIERRMPFTDYELIRFDFYGDEYTKIAGKFLLSKGIKIVKHTFGHNDATYFSYPTPIDVYKKMQILLGNLSKNA